MAKIFRKTFFLVLYFGFLAIFIVDYFDLAIEKDGIIQLFDMKKNLYITLLHIKREEVDAPMRPIMKNYYIDLVSEISN